MAEIVLGIGTSHSPLLTLDARGWIERAQDDMRSPVLTLSDGRDVDYAMLLAERGPIYAHSCAEGSLERQSAAAQRALDRLANAIEHQRPDVVLIIGDDQEELFAAGNTPSLAIHCGGNIAMRPLSQLMPDAPAWMKSAFSGYAMDGDRHFTGAPAFATDLIERLMDKEVDLGVTSTVPDPRVAAFGHAYGFIFKRLFRGRDIPVVPILLNTYYPPNVMRPGRCFDVGRKLAETIGEMNPDLRVAVIASGGLSHFVTDADLDRLVLDALRSRDENALRSIPMKALRAGSSEILCWIMAGGALAGLTQFWSEYLPVYRTAAGSGIGLAFAIWNRAGEGQA